MPQMTEQERSEMEMRVREHNYTLLASIQANLEPLRATLDAIESDARQLVVMNGDEVLRIRDILTGTIGSLKSMLEYHVNSTLPQVVDAYAPAAPQALPPETPA